MPCFCLIQEELFEKEMKNPPMMHSRVLELSWADGGRPGIFDKEGIVVDGLFGSEGTAVDDVVGKSSSVDADDIWGTSYEAEKSRGVDEASGGVGGSGLSAREMEGGYWGMSERSGYIILYRKQNKRVKKCGALHGKQR